MSAVDRKDEYGTYPPPDPCRVLGIGRSKIYELIAAGDLTARKLGRKTLIPREDIVAFATRLPAGKPTVGGA